MMNLMSLSLLSSSLLPKVSPLLNMLMLSWQTYKPLYMLPFNNLLLINDHLSHPLIMLSLLIFSTCYLSSSNHTLTIYIVPLFMLTLLIFSTKNLILFFCFYELSLLPILLMMLKWGYQPERLSASIYLLMYTALCSIPFLALIMLKVDQYMMYHMNILPSSYLLKTNSTPLTLMMTLIFLVKVPTFLLHSWLPKAHVESPALGSMILASVMLKFGLYGLFRTSILILPLTMMKYIFPFALCGMITVSCNILSNPDIKVLIALSSVAHMAMATAAASLMNTNSMFNSTMMITAHGFTSSALFFMSGILFYNSNSRSLFMNSGTLNYTPLNTYFWVFFTAFNSGFPPSLNFYSEISSYANILILSPLSTISLSLSIILSCTAFLLLLSFQIHKPKKLSLASMLMTPKYLLTLTNHLIPTSFTFLTLELLN